MLISELPEELRRLAEKRRTAPGLTNESHDDLLYAFDWTSTPEGFDFWHKIHSSRKKDLPPELLKQQ